MPKSCHRDTSGVVIFDGTIIVVTPTQYMALDEAKDEWTQNKFTKRLGEKIHAFVYEQQICAFVRKSRGTQCYNATEFCVKEYDLLNNKWSRIVNRIPGGWTTHLTCAI